MALIGQYCSVNGGSDWGDFSGTTDKMCSSSTQMPQNITNFDVNERKHVTWGSQAGMSLINSLGTRNRAEL